MKLISSIIVLIFIVFLGLPYVQIYRLDSALKSNDAFALNAMVDLQAVRKMYKASLEENMKNMVGTEQNNTFSNLMQRGAQMLSDAAVDAIDMQWVKEEIHQKTEGATILNTMSFAFFESPTRFMIRIGEMYQNPVHVQMTLQDWTWRVTAIYT